VPSALPRSNLFTFIRRIVQANVSSIYSFLFSLSAHLLGPLESLAPCIERLPRGLLEAIRHSLRTPRPFTRGRGRWLAMRARWIHLSRARPIASPVDDPMSRQTSSLWGSALKDAPRPGDPVPYPRDEPGSRES